MFIGTTFDTDPDPTFERKSFWQIVMTLTNNCWSKPL